MAHVYHYYSIAELDTEARALSGIDCNQSATPKKNILHLVRREMKRQSRFKGGFKENKKSDDLKHFELRKYLSSFLHIS